jgi:hypothetical protein
MMTEQETRARAERAAECDAVEFTVTLSPVAEGWEWKILEVGCICTGSGIEPTRAKARDSAINALKLGYAEGEG